MISEPHNLPTYATFGVINAFTEVVHTLRERNNADNAVAVARRSAFTETNSALLDASANPFVNSTSWKILEIGGGQQMERARYEGINRLLAKILFIN